MNTIASRRQLDAVQVDVLNLTMAADDPRGTVWTDREVDLVVAVYFEMLGQEIAGQSFVKSHKNAELQALTGRSRGSVERKLQNVSAVLDRLGLPWIWGYKPLANFQEALLFAVERYIDASASPYVVPVAPEQTGLADASALFIEAPPSLAPREEPAEPRTLRRLVRKFDPAARDARNRDLGYHGEERVFFSEQARLRKADRADLARKMKWVSQEEGDGAGYDILSFSETGAERLLEVKTTVGSQKTPFFLTENERSFSEERADAFRLVRLYDFAREPKAFELLPPLEHLVVLSPTNYRASFG